MLSLVWWNCSLDTLIAIQNSLNSHNLNLSVLFDHVLYHLRYFNLKRGSSRELNAFKIVGSPGGVNSGDCLCITWKSFHCCFDTDIRNLQLLSLHFHCCRDRTQQGWQLVTGTQGLPTTYQSLVMGRMTSASLSPFKYCMRASNWQHPSLTQKPCCQGI